MKGSVPKCQGKVVLRNNSANIYPREAKIYVDLIGRILNRGGVLFGIYALLGALMFFSKSGLGRWQSIIFMPLDFTWLLVQIPLMFIANSASKAEAILTPQIYGLWIIAASTLLWAVMGGFFWENVMVAGVKWNKKLPWIVTCLAVALSLYVSDSGCIGENFSFNLFLLSVALFVWFISNRFGGSSVGDSILKTVKPAVVLLPIFFFITQMGSFCEPLLPVTATGFSRIKPHLAGSGITREGTPNLVFTNGVGTTIMINSMRIDMMDGISSSCEISPAQIMFRYTRTNVMPPGESFQLINVTGCLPPGAVATKYNAFISISYNVTIGGQTSQHVENGTLRGAYE
jgi:hypothetical protein